MVTSVPYFCFPDKPMKGGDILDFYKEGNLRKGGVDLEKEGMTLLPTVSSILYSSFSNVLYNPWQNVCSITTLKSVRIVSYKL